MLYTDKTKKAMVFMFSKHKNQVDKSGIPYAFHPYHLAEQMTDEVSVCVALLHDVVEDTDTTFEDLSGMGFGDEVVDTLRLLTHTDDKDYYEYVSDLSLNITAVRVKLADLRHNSDLTRLNVVDEKALKRVEKYRKCISFLEEQMSFLERGNMDLAKENAEKFREKHV